MVVEEVPGRTALWLELLRRVTREYEGWCVWKNAESAFAGHGDIDSFALPRDWPGIERLWREWVRDSGLGPAIVCRHVPQGPHLITLQPDSPYLLQFDVKVRATFRGCSLMDVWQLAELAEMDDRGFRRIRPGAEGVIKLVYNGMHHGGAINREGLDRKRIPELLRSDPVGVRMAVELVGWAGPALTRGIDALLDGEWDQQAMQTVELWGRLKSVINPGVALSRIWFNQGPLRTCPVLRVIRQDDRRIPDDREGWLREVAAGHVIYKDQPGVPLSEERHVS